MTKQILTTVFENEVFSVAHDLENVYVVNKQTGIKEMTTKRLLEALYQAEDDCMQLLRQSYIVERHANKVMVS
jgi:hypothetical protein